MNAYQVNTVAAKIGIILILIFAMLISCTKKQNEKPELKGTLKVWAIGYKEYSNDYDWENFKVSVKGTNTELTQLTGKDGTCYFQNLPTGIYTIVTSKDGYRPYEERNFTFVGTDTTSFATMGQKSTTKIKSYSLKISHDTLTISGIVSHTCPVSESMYNLNLWPTVCAFYSSSTTPPYIQFGPQYIRTDRYQDTVFNCSIKLTSPLPLSLNSLTSGVKYYVIIYGVNPNSYFAYFAKPHEFENTFGDPSEIKYFIAP